MFKKKPVTKLYRWSDGEIQEVNILTCKDHKYFTDNIFTNDSVVPVKEVNGRWSFAWFGSIDKLLKVRSKEISENERQLNQEKEEWKAAKSKYK